MATKMESLAQRRDGMSSDLGFRRLWTGGADSVLSHVYAANGICLRMLADNYIGKLIVKRLLYRGAILTAIRADLSRPGMAPI